MRGQRPLLSRQPPPLEVQELRQAVFGKSWHDLRGVSNRSGQVAPGNLDADERQERHQFVGASPWAWCDTENGMVHAPAHPACNADRDVRKDGWTGRGR